MRVFFIIILNSLILFSCKTNDKASIHDSKENADIANNQEITNHQQDTIDIYIPKFAMIVPQYFPFDENILKEPELKKYKNVQSKLTELSGNFLGDTDENDILGHPDLDYDGLTIWINDSKRKKVSFNAKKISKRYGLYYDNDKLILVTEAIERPEGFKIDSIFFDDKILIWKNTNNDFVKDERMILGKEDYLKRLSSEIQEIYINELDYIEKYNYTKDSLSSFVIANLKK